LYRRVAAYVDKLVTGAKPADLPVERPTEFDFVINQKSAQAMALSIPPAVLQRATELIQ
jgi:putative tryptophan/tyrosine transport system substrate-binding protein